MQIWAERAHRSVSEIAQELIEEGLNDRTGKTQCLLALEGPLLTRDRSASAASGLRSVPGCLPTDTPNGFLILM